MQIVIDIPDDRIPETLETVDINLAFINGHVYGCTYPFQELPEGYEALKARPTGEWIRVSIDKYVQHAMAFYRCSECGNDIIGEHNYCPNCGAKMNNGE